MRGPNPKYPINLTTEQEQQLRQLVNSRKAGQGQVLRARIILRAYDHPEWSNQQIAPKGAVVTASFVSGANVGLKRVV